MKLVFCACARVLSMIWKGGKQISSRDKTCCHCWVVQHDQQTTATILCEIQGRGKQTLCQLYIADSIFPQVILTLGVCKSPSAIQEVENLNAVGEDLHLSARSKNHANMSAAQGRPRVRFIACRWWNGKIDVGERACPFLDIHDFCHECILIHQRECLESITKTIETAS